MILLRSKEETRSLLKEFTKDHEEFLNRLISSFEHETEPITCCPEAYDCQYCPFNSNNSVMNRDCHRERNALGIAFSEHSKDEIVGYLKELKAQLTDTPIVKNKFYKRIDAPYIRKYNMTDSVKRREMMYGEILFKNISFLTGGGSVIIINEKKTGGVIYGRKAKKHFRRLAKQNPMYNLKSIKHLCNNNIEQISFRIEEKSLEQTEVYNI